MASSPDQSKGSKRKKKGHSEEGRFMYELGTCSKKNDLPTALTLYEKAVSQNLHLLHNHFDTLIYLCSNAIKTDSSYPKDSAIEKGFEIFNDMLARKINPTEATITAVARLAQAKEDGDYAFELVKGMGKYKISPRLRTYDPALFTFCQKSDVEKAYEVEEHMVGMGVNLEEPQLAVLMKVSGEFGKAEKVYSYLQRMRNSVRCVSGLTAEIIEGWFKNPLASEVGRLDWDENQIRDVILKNGGGWHGQGWLGKGKWVVFKSNISSDGRCLSCGQQLACVDIDPAETEKLAESVASLALAREANKDFKLFQEWLDKHAKYEALVDGANVGLYQQNFADGGFSIYQLDAIVKELYQRSGNKWPLVILHNKRVRSLMNNPSNRNLVETWQKEGALYTTPNGSNDDWYWLYAAVKLKCLVVTNDEMRDHIFELLASNFFFRWKERHRVQFTFPRNKLKLLMPPPYSLVIQESEKGYWHVPVEGECSDELSRTWLCITRPRFLEGSNQVVKDLHAPVTDDDALASLPASCFETGKSVNGSNVNPNSFTSFNNDSMGTMTGKRKHRSPSPSKGDPQYQ